MFLHDAVPMIVKQWKVLFVAALLCPHLLFAEKQASLQLDHFKSSIDYANEDLVVQHIYQRLKPIEVRVTKSMNKSGVHDDSADKCIRLSVQVDNGAVDSIYNITYASVADSLNYSGFIGLLRETRLDPRYAITSMRINIKIVQKARIKSLPIISATAAVLLAASIMLWFWDWHTVRSL